MQLYSRAILNNVLRDQTLGDIRKSGHYMKTESSNQFFFFVITNVLQKYTVTATREKFKLKSQGSGSQLKQALTSITVTSNLVIFNKNSA